MRTGTRWTLRRRQRDGKSPKPLQTSVFNPTEAAFSAVQINSFTIHADNNSDHSTPRNRPILRPSDKITGSVPSIFSRMVQALCHFRLKWSFLGCATPPNASSCYSLNIETILQLLGLCPSRHCIAVIFTAWRKYHQIIHLTVFSRY